MNIHDKNSRNMQQKATRFCLSLLLASKFNTFSVFWCLFIKPLKLMDLF